MDLETTSHPRHPRVDTRLVGKVPPHDGRSWQSLFRKRLRKALIEHLGGRATVTQQCIIDAAVEIGLELEVMKRRRDQRGGLSAHDARGFLAYQNTYRRHLVALGIKGATSATPTLAQYIARKSEPTAA